MDGLASQYGAASCVHPEQSNLPVGSAAGRLPVALAVSLAGESGDLRLRLVHSKRGRGESRRVAGEVRGSKQLDAALPVLPHQSIGCDEADRAPGRQRLLLRGTRRRHVLLETLAAASRSGFEFSVSHR